MVTRYASALLTVAGVIALVLGLLFWSGNALRLGSVHMLLGFLTVAALWVIAIGQAVTRGGSWILAACAIAVGLLLIILGMNQATLWVGDRHWVIQIIHLILGILTIGLGHMAAARAKRNGLF